MDQTTTNPMSAAPRPVAPVFAAGSFALGATGVVLAPVVAAVLHVILGDRFGLPAGTATALSLGGAALWAIAGGGAAAAVGRRLAFYEILAAALVLLALSLGPVVLLLPRLRGLPLPLHAWESQGRVVLVVGLVLVGVASGALAFLGSTLSYLFTGSGRLDPSFGYELYIARSHIRLSPRMLVGLFLIVVTGVVPGLLAGVAWSLWRDAAERRAARRGEPHERPRLPATMLMTLISIGGVATGVWALTVVLSVMSGFEADLKKKILGAHAHGVVLKYGQNDFAEWKQVMDRVRTVPGVAAATPFLYNEVMLSAGNNLTGSVLKGIDPATVGGVTDLSRDMEEGKLEWLSRPSDIPESRRAQAKSLREAIGGREDVATASPPPPKGGAAEPGPERPREKLPGIVVGRELARSLRVGVGDAVNVVSPFGDIGPAGPQPKSRPFRVAGIFYSGMYEYDAKFAYLDLAEAQRFFGTGDSVTGLELKVADVDAARPIMRRVLGALDGYPYRTKDWGEMNRNLFSALAMEKIVMAVILGFIVLVASFIIVATLVMLVLEKTREIAVLKSMGAGLPSIMKIFVAEGIVIGAVGTAFGLLLGLGTCLLIDKVGIPLDPEVYYISNLPVLIEPAQFALVALAALALSYLATIYPATKASRLRPVDGLRSE
ncbi:MAG TPA: ABC transporter permease [Anaeromyxobacteraceae bacterium]|nr:ABC transporter permease [Anaeromyxobacteraceae bacterium]